MLAILSVGTLVFSQCDKSSNVACKRRVRKSHGENLVSPGKLDAGGQVELEQQQLRKKSDGGVRRRGTGSIKSVTTKSLISIPQTQSAFNCKIANHSFINTNARGIRSALRIGRTQF